MKLGIDIGGTDVKFAVISKNEIIYKSKIRSESTYIAFSCSAMGRGKLARVRDV